MSKFIQANQKIENAVVDGYKKVEKTVVSGYKKVEDKFVDTFLAEEGESTEDAKARIANNLERMKQVNAEHKEG